MQTRHLLLGTALLLALPAGHAADLWVTSSAALNPVASRCSVAVPCHSTSFASLPATTQGGPLDLSFDGGDGFFTYNDPDSWEFVQDMAIDSQGRILLKWGAVSSRPVRAHHFDSRRSRFNVDVQVAIWRRDYNEVRPHSSLDQQALDISGHLKPPFRAM